MKFDLEKTIYGKVTQVLSTPSKDSLITEQKGEIAVTLEGFPNDRHSGHSRISGGREKHYYESGTYKRNNRQWSALSEEELAIIAKEMGIPEVKAEWVGANVIFEGIPNFSKLPPLSHIYINPDAEDYVCLVVFEENGPCQHPNKVIIGKNEKTGINKTFMIAAKGLRGTVGWVDRPGDIHVGDEVKVLVPLS